jgi:hypothetical protein
MDIYFRPNRGGREPFEALGLPINANGHVRAMTTVPIYPATRAAGSPKKAVGLAEQATFTRTIVGQPVIQLTYARRRREWKHWWAVWSEYRATPGHHLVCCAYCARLRRSKEWASIPSVLSQALHKFPKPVLSHGYCPDCIKRHFPETAANTNCAPDRVRRPAPS